MGCGQKEILSELTSGSIEPEAYAVTLQAAPGTDLDSKEVGLAGRYRICHRSDGVVAANGCCIDRDFRGSAKTVDG